MAKARIHIIACGGTIAGKAPSEEELIGYHAGELTIEELVDTVPGLSACADITGEQLCNIDSSDMSEALWLQLVEKVQAAVNRDDIDGVVITHGTDTMEETAYFLNLTVHTTKPVILVGSMRPATALSADGPLNLLDAVHVAGFAEAGQYGVLIAMNGQIGGARNTTKTNTAHVDAFRSWELGFVGYIQNGVPYFYQLPARRHTAASQLDCRGVKQLPKVAIIYCHVGLSAELIHAAVQGAQGIVVAGFGHGNMPEAIKDALLAEQEKQRLIIVRTSRTGGGIVSVTGEDDKSGFIAGDNLSCQKAKILLQLALLKTVDRATIQHMFALY